ncbi:3'-5' exonuclease [Paenarthrobacter sp. YJN-5]|uniref:3'-5' exonuclease n=1 Tax=Paenarthrobacter sp. YJN-5 TaxID=2735316 RepID=UPI00187824F1|nr:3'-5' exonuclease [Paenarthrobacter sp. YJN-5]QOT19391.1 3'-5' exonuclease [Paenarthrobacter sp. YJN-5]
MIPGLDFVAIDFELANPKHSSICQIGLVKVRDGVLGKTHTHYVMPPPGHQNFGQRQIDVHGITRRMIDGADGWDLMLPRLEAFAGDLPLVAHNVTAERSMIRQTTEAAGLDLPDFTYYCTQRAAQLHIPDQGPFRLNVLVERLGLPPLQHHDAGEDAAAAAHLAVKLALITGISDVHELFPAMKPSPSARKAWKK